MEKVKDNGLVLQMQSFSVHDGEGIRTTIFLHGCPLRCNWCANPDSWMLDKECCKSVTVAEVLHKVSRDEIFYRFSGGGVTFSGGEPTMQHEFLRGMVLELDKRCVDMWIESCGYFEWETVKDIFGYFTHVFYDIKHMDSLHHKEYTGKENDVILENAKKIYNLGVEMTIRIPVMQQVNFTEKNLVATARFMSTYLPNADIELLPYHNLGHEKYKAHGLEKYIYDYEVPDQEELKWAESLFQSYGIKTISYK